MFGFGENVIKVGTVARGIILLEICLSASAVTLAQTGELQKALPIFKDAFSRNDNLRELVPRIVKAGFLTDDQNVLQQILAQ